MNIARTDQRLKTKELSSFETFGYVKRMAALKHPDWFLASAELLFNDYRVSYWGGDLKAAMA